MTIVMYDLAGADPELRFSPYCWRIKMALAHKGLALETRPWRFTEKAVIAPGGLGRVPTIIDNGKWLADSWAIANYLEDTYADRPSIFGGAAGRALARFYNDWTDGVLQPAVIRFVLTDIHDVIAEKDRAYFRSSREERFGTTLEKVCEGRETRLADFRKSLAPLRATLTAQPFLGGATPLYPDYIVFGAFQWPRCVSAFELLAPDDPIAAWRDRLLDAFDGMARRAKTAAR
jgi:glutathione S-transferase